MDDVMINTMSVNVWDGGHGRKPDGSDQRKGFVYRFVNWDMVVIYVGVTDDILKRIRTHMCNGHLPEEAYHETVAIEYAEFRNYADANLYEQYLIGILQPKYNTAVKGRGRPTVEIEEFDSECIEWRDMDELVFDEDVFPEDVKPTWRRWERPTEWPDVRSDFDYSSSGGPTHRFIAKRVLPADLLLYDDGAYGLGDGLLREGVSVEGAVGVVPHARDVESYSPFVDLLLSVLFGGNDSVYGKEPSPARLSFEEVLGHCLLREPGRYQRLFVLGNVGGAEWPPEVLEELLNFTFGIDNTAGMRFGDVVGDWTDYGHYGVGKLLCLDKCYELMCGTLFGGTIVMDCSRRRAERIRKWVSGEEIVIRGSSESESAHPYRFRNYGTTVLMTAMESAEEVREHVGAAYPEFAFIPMSDCVEKVIAGWDKKKFMGRSFLTEADAQYLLALAENGLRRLIANDGKLTCEL